MEYYLNLADYYFVYVPVYLTLKNRTFCWKSCRAVNIYFFRMYLLGVFGYIRRLVSRRVTFRTPRFENIFGSTTEAEYSSRF